jgi:hypothetical protein
MNVELAVLLGGFQKMATVGVRGVRGAGVRWLRRGWRSRGGGIGGPVPITPKVDRTVTVVNNITVEEEQWR